MRKALGSEDNFVVFLITMPILFILITNLNNGTIFGTTNSTISTSNSTDCQSYITQVSTMQSQIDQLYIELSNAKNSDSGFSPWQLIFGFMAGAGVVILYFLWHENQEKERKAFDKLYLNKKARKKV
jgi:uncharacterized membrane protein YjjP (DUF1212 family)